MTPFLGKEAKITPCLPGKGPLNTKCRKPPPNQAEVAEIAENGRHRPKVDENTRIWPNSAQIRSKSARFGSCLAQVGRTLCDAGPRFADFVEAWAKLADRRECSQLRNANFPKLAELRPTLAELGRCWSKAGKI